MEVELNLEQARWAWAQVVLLLEQLHQLVLYLEAANQVGNLICLAAHSLVELSLGLELLNLVEWEVLEL